MYKLLFVTFCLFCNTLFSQVGPGVWQDHLSMNSCNSVTRNGSTVYGSYVNGLVLFDESEQSTRTLNKINGLSDVGIRLLRTNPYNNKVLVIYENSNIDVIDLNENISNYPSIKLKSLNGKKIINEVSFDKQLAYLACGFGIVVFDTEKLEVRETYIIGPGASNLEVNEVVLRDSLIYAATELGIYRANKNALLNDFKNWRPDTTDLPSGPYCGIKNVQGTLVTCYTPSNIDVANAGKDSVYWNVQGQWQKYPFLNEGYSIRKMGATYQNMFSIVDPIGLLVWDLDAGISRQHLTTYKGQVDYGTWRDSYIGKDPTGNIAYWIADVRFGLNRFYQYYEEPFNVTRNGINRNAKGNIDIYKGKVAVSPSFVSNTGTGNYLREGINILRGDNWTYLPCFQDDGVPVMDITSVLWDRIDTSRMWICSWYYGVSQYRKDKLITPSYTSSNTSMPQILVNEPRCSGLSMDKDGNVWFANSDQKDFLSVIKRSNGAYQNFAFETARGFTRKTFVDRNNYVWILHERGGGLTVFNHVNFNQPQLNVNYRWLNNAIGSGNLQSNAVFAIAEDQDGKIWVGTGEGISVFYNPTALFRGGDFDSQPIKIVQDGNVELLLGKDIVTSICVDGANNKWCGTQSGGVYCFSPDGLTQIHHFTSENSPLYSNTLVDISYDEVTGDLFFATDLGLQSYRGTVVAGAEAYNEVYAYPNPVKPGYQSNVLVRGLIDQSIVKIVDASGNMVWETKSKGGQIEWPVTNLSNARVTSGVYVVYASTTNGEFKALTKILVVN